MFFYIKQKKNLMRLVENVFRKLIEKTIYNIYNI